MLLNCRSARHAGALALLAALALAPVAHAADAPSPQFGAPAAAEAPDPNGPRIEFSSEAWDFKEIDYKAPCEHVFKIRNAGKDTLRIRSTASSCGCTVPSMARKNIPPGESEELKVTYDSNRKGTFHKTVTVSSNDKARSSVVLSIEGDIVSEVNVSPQWGVRWPTPIHREDLAASIQRITVSTARLDKLEIEKLESANLHLTWKILDGPDPKTKFIDLGVKPDAPAGLLNTNLVIHTNSPKQPVTDVQVYAEVVGEIEVTPTQLFFRSDPGGIMLDDKFMVRDRKAKGNFKIVDIKDDGGNLEFTTETVKPDTAYTIHAKARQIVYKTGFFSGNVTITTNRAGEETLKVSYSGHVDAPPGTVKR